MTDLIALASIAILCVTAFAAPVYFGRRDRLWLGAGIAIACLIITGAIGITMSVRQSTQFADRCESAGGTTYHARKSTLCLDGEGRIIR